MIIKILIGLAMLITFLSFDAGFTNKSIAPTLNSKNIINQTTQLETKILAWYRHNSNELPQTLNYETLNLMGIDKSFLNNEIKYEVLGKNKFLLQVQLSDGTIWTSAYSNKNL